MIVTVTVLAAGSKEIHCASFWVLLLSFASATKAMDETNAKLAIVSETNVATGFLVGTAYPPRARIYTVIDGMGTRRIRAVARWRSGGLSGWEAGG
jgi:hypothetical protein